MSDQGLFCWYELTTTDCDAAQAFYESLLGWTVTPSGMPNIDYRIASIDGVGIAGVMGPFDGAPPPNWRGYVAVDSADETHAAATAAGATTHVPPTDIPGVGRFAIFSDPQGATIALLQPLPTDDPPPHAVDKPGSVSWHELSVKDIDAAWEFYEPLFQWRRGERQDMGPMGFYQLFGPQQVEHDFGGIAGPMDQAGWLYYFNIPAIDAAVERVKSGGGSVAMVHEIPGSRWIAICTDPQGARFALIAPQR